MARRRPREPPADIGESGSPASKPRCRSLSTAEPAKQSYQAPIRLPRAGHALRRRAPALRTGALGDIVHLAADRVCDAAVATAGPTISASACRSQPPLDRKLEGLIGFFVNMLVIRVDLEGAPSFDDLLQRFRPASSRRRPIRTCRSSRWSRRSIRTHARA